MLLSRACLRGGLNLLKPPAVQESHGASLEAVLPGLCNRGREEMELSAKPTTTKDMAQYVCGTYYG